MYLEYSLILDLDRGKFRICLNRFGFKERLKIPKQPWNKDPDQLKSIMWV